MYKCIKNFKKLNKTRSVKNKDKSKNCNLRGGRNVRNNCRILSESKERQQKLC